MPVFLPLIRGEYKTLDYAVIAARGNCVLSFRLLGAGMNNSQVAATVKLRSSIAEPEYIKRIASYANVTEIADEGKELPTATAFHAAWKATDAHRSSVAFDIDMETPRDNDETGAPKWIINGDFQKLFAKTLIDIAKESGGTLLCTPEMLEAYIGNHLYHPFNQRIAAEREKTFNDNLSAADIVHGKPELQKASDDAPDEVNVLEQAKKKLMTDTSEDDWSEDDGDDEAEDYDDYSDGEDDDSGEETPPSNVVSPFEPAASPVEQSGDNPKVNPENT